MPRANPILQEGLHLHVQWQWQWQRQLANGMQCCILQMCINRLCSKLIISLRIHDSCGVSCVVIIIIITHHLPTDLSLSLSLPLLSPVTSIMHRHTHPSFTVTFYPHPSCHSHFAPFIFIASTCATHISHLTHLFLPSDSRSLFPKQLQTANYTATRPRRQQLQLQLQPPQQQLSRSHHTACFPAVALCLMARTRKTMSLPASTQFRTRQGSTQVRS